MADTTMANDTDYLSMSDEEIRNMTGPGAVTSVPDDEEEQQDTAAEGQDTADSNADADSDSPSQDTPASEDADEADGDQPVAESANEDSQESRSETTQSASKPKAEVAQASENRR